MKQGDPLVLPTPSGERRFTVGAVFQNYLAIQGGVYMNLEQFSRTFGRSPPHEAAVWQPAPQQGGQVAQRDAVDCLKVEPLH